MHKTRLTASLHLKLHELTHQRVYLDHSTEFNEALASAVAEVATEQWLMTNAPERLVAYANALRMRAQFDALLSAHKDRLDALYGSALSDVQKRARKPALEAQLRADYAALKASKWGGDARYDSWFDAPVNNARVAGFSSYRALVDDFKRLLAHCENDYEQFFMRLESFTLGDEVKVPGRCVEY